VTLHVPANTVQGTYSGTIALSVDGASTAYLPLQLEVYNFTLEQPNQMYGVYYFGQTNSSYPSGTIGPRYKSVTQYTAEVQGMLQHGIRYPSLDMFLYSDWATNPNGLRDMKLRVSLGFPTDYLFWITPGAWGTVPSTQSQLDACKAKTATYLSAAKVGGFQNFVNFGVDEASLSVLASEVPAFTSVRAAGAKNVIADYNSYNVASQVPNIVGLMDFVIWPNVAWNHPELAVVNWHNAGAKVFDYGDPHPWSEDPLLYRRNYGWKLFKSNFDGSFDFAYQAFYGSNESSGVIWNDFAMPVGNHRTQIYAYPTTNGCVDTVQYEGLREAINDMRYLATLQKAINDHPGTAATAAKTWISQVSPGGDLDEIRGQMVDRIKQILGN
jgi:hypothetical protein